MAMFESLTDRLSAVLKRISGRGVLRPEDVDLALKEVRMALLEADVNYKVVKQFTAQVRERLVGTETKDHLTPPQQVVQAVHEQLRDLLGGNDQGVVYSPAPPTVLMLVGLQGAGKTTASIKLALFTRREGHTPMVVGLDLRRPAAVEQLRVLAEREKVAFFSGAGDVEDIARRALEEARLGGRDVVILDTSGRLSIDAELMDELRRLRAAIPITESLLVADAMTGQEAVTVGEAFHEAVGIDGVMLTKLDGDVRGGAALSFKLATGQTVRFAGVGEKPEDLEVFHADRMAQRILGMGDVMTLIERAERTLDEETQQQVERNLRQGNLTFDDFLLQLKQLRSMGSLQSVLEMVPGGNQLMGQVAGDPEAEMRRMEAIILSMTRQERARPDIIKGSRRRRIARGSGAQVSDVNKLLKARDQMQQMVKQFGLGGMPQLGGRRRGSALSGLGRLLG
ncbi:MAG: signal recognition particle protein [Candidatus Dormibacteraceae bacterium]